MNTRKDEAGRDTGVPAGPGSSRPHATLDLKATAVTPASATDDKAQSAAQAGNAGAASALPGASPRGDAGAAEPEPAKRPEAVPGRARGYGSFFTHLATGVVGGVVALLAADMLASELGLSGPNEHPGTSAALQQRIAALEAQSKQTAGAPDLALRLTAAEAKLGKLERLGGTVDGLSQRQGELARDLKAIDAKVGAQGGDGSAEVRIAKLEEQLSALSAAATRDPQSGALAQLAAMSGKVADLETRVNAELDTLRKNVSQEIDTRLAAATDASEAARSGTQRVGRELAGIMTENAELGARFDALKAESDRATAALRTTADELARLKTELDARLAAFAKPEDVASAVTPLEGKLAALREDVQGVVKSEEGRKATAGRIVLSLELASLKRAIDRGKGYAAELAQTRKLSDGSIDLAPLERFADTGVPTPAGLRQEFRPVAFKIIDAAQAPAEGGIVERLLAGAKSVVRVRKVSHDADEKTAEAVVARMEQALNEDRPGDVLQEARTLPQPAQDAAKDYLAKVEARFAVDRALAEVEAQLKASLGSPAGDPGKARE